MSKTANKVDEKNKLIRILLMIIGLLTVLVIHAHHSVMTTPKDWNVWTPPDLSVGGKRKLDEVPKVEAYNFAQAMWTRVNLWYSSGTQEYPKKLGQYRFYFGSTFVKDELRKVERDNESYRNRSRTMEAVKGEYSVESLGNNRFNVTFLVRMVERLGGSKIKDVYIEYSFRVEEYSVPRSVNPWQLKVVDEIRPARRVNYEPS